ncbi:MAG TPA: DUF2786 domain-containing protein [Trebonia sp.]|nr:DUF2786 domain-containing protein [Trebonia sp.]
MGEGASPDKDQVAALAGDALRQLAGGGDAAYARLVDQLSAQWSPGWPGEVSSTLSGFLRTAVTSAWRAGWQPAELARHVGREASPAHAAMAADMIAAEMRSYGAATVDPRWSAQVSAIAPDGSWWGSDDGYLSAWRRRANDYDPTTGVATALETLNVLRSLPVQEKLLPPPGSALPAASARDTAARDTAARDTAGRPPPDQRMLGRIRALLAKAESTEFAAEAEALSGRAQELMARYSIDHALLAAQDGRSELPGGRRIPVDSPYEEAKVALLNTVADANRCRAVWLQELGLVTVVGFEPDLDAVELLFTSLLVQANTAMIRAGGKKDTLGNSRTKAFRQSFLVAYAVRIGERLAAAAARAEQEAVAEHEAEHAKAPAAGADTAGIMPSPGADLVPFLAARTEAVDDAVAEIFGGRLKRGRSARVSDAEGWASGRAAADLASLLGRGVARGST